MSDERRPGRPTTRGAALLLLLPWACGGGDTPVGLPDAGGDTGSPDAPDIRDAGTTDAGADGAGDAGADAGCGGCLVDGRCFGDGEAPEPARPCLRCDAASGAVAQADGTCLIGDTCYEAGELREYWPCQVCDPGADPAAFTLLPDWCFIWTEPSGLGPNCVAAGEAEERGCGRCQPELSISRFTGACRAGAECFDGGSRSPTGCSVCDAETASWVAADDATVTLYDFDDGTLQGWEVLDEPIGGVAWQVDDGRSRSGDYALYFGNPETRTYEGAGGKVRGDVLSPQVALAGPSEAIVWIWSQIPAPKTGAIPAGAASPRHKTCGCVTMERRRRGSTSASTLPASG